MRTVIFFGLLCIADAIGAYTGWKMQDKTLTVGDIIFGVAIVYDIVDFFKK